MTRCCLAHDCGTVVRVGQWFCADHWFATPVTLRDDLLNAWRTWNRARPDADAGTKAELTSAYSHALQAAIDVHGSRYTDIFGNSVSAKVTVETAGEAVGCHASETGRAAAGTPFTNAARPFVVVPYLGDAA